ncbi:MAG: hypothetical protein IJB67_01045 [Firmicutes bacterium]|nr:hypothetical protein [Bacillota bacterium]
MKKIRKVLALTLCAIALVGASVMGTMAYLTDNDTVTNTFTVGNVDIMLDERDVDNDDNNSDNREVDGVVRDKANAYNLLPGHTYIKDPTVTVVQGSEDAYVRMLVTVENIDKLKAALPNESTTAKYYAGDVFLLQMLCLDEDGKNTWKESSWEYKKYTPSTDAKVGTYEFWYNDDDDKATVGTLPALFEKITLPGAEINNTEIANLKDVTITVTAHAIQADGFANADEAWGEFDVDAPAYEPTT